MTARTAQSSSNTPAPESRQTRPSVAGAAPYTRAIASDPPMTRNAITTEFLKENPITYIDTFDTGLELEETTDEEPVSKELLSRLRALGYIE